MWWARKRYHMSSGTLSNWQIWPSLANSISNICCCASYPAELIIVFAHFNLLIISFVLAFCSCHCLPWHYCPFITTRSIFSLKDSPFVLSREDFVPPTETNSSLFYFTLLFTLMQALAYFLNTFTVSPPSVIRLLTPDHFIRCAVIHYLVFWSVAS